MTAFENVGALAAAVGTRLGPTEWLRIDQERVNTFADATDDHQWIHVDADTACDGPFGGTIAHGLLTLSLLPFFSRQLYTVGDVAMAINYGYDRVRFITPVMVGAKVRASGEITAVVRFGNASQLTMTMTVEIEGSAKPAAVAESIVRYVE